VAIFGKPGASYLQPSRLDIFVRSREAMLVHLWLVGGTNRRRLDAPALKWTIPVSANGTTVSPVNMTSTHMFDHASALGVPTEGAVQISARLLRVQSGPVSAAEWSRDGWRSRQRRGGLA
jgi:hypothetical protein